MMRAWKELVIKWLNCFGGKPIETIKDVRERDFVSFFSVSFTNETAATPFEKLLSYLQDNYPHFDDTLSNSHSITWTNEDELYVLSSLLLLNASIYHPSPFFQQNAAQNLSPADQELIVHFLQKAMVHDHLISKQTLLECIPSDLDGDESKECASQKRASLDFSSSPLTHKRRSGTPLAEFLSSPVARQKRRSNLSTVHRLEYELEEEQEEKIQLKDKVTNQEIQIADLVKRYQEKVDEVKILQNQLIEANDTLSEEKVQDKEERLKLHQELADSEKYIRQLEEELDSRKTAEQSLYQKATVSEERSHGLEALVTSLTEEMTNLKEKLSLQTEENFELQFKCSQLERDLNQVQMLSPRRQILNSPNQTPCLSPLPESLGFIVEREMMDKEIENDQLRLNIKELSDELGKLKDIYTELEEQSSKNTEIASRTQKKMEFKLQELQKNLDATSQELLLCKRESEDFCSKLTDALREKENLLLKVNEVVVENRTLLSEQKMLQDSKHSLEVKVAQMNAKLTISEEREKELFEIAKERLSELSSMTQKMEDMEMAMKKSLKEQELIDQQLSETKKKLINAKSLELEKNDLEEQVATLKRSHDDLEVKSKDAYTAMKTLEKKLHAEREEKKAIEIQLQDVNNKRNDLTLSLNLIAAEKEAIAAENISLMQEKVRWEADLNEALQNVKEARVQAAKEVADKKSLQDKLVETMALNDVLASNLSIASQQEDDLSSNLKEILKQKKIIENQLSVTTKEKDQLELLLHEVSSQLEVVCEERDSLSKNLADKASELEDISSKLSVLLNGKVDLEAQLSDGKSENRKLQLQLSGVMQKLELAQSEVSQLKEESEVLAQQCEEKTSAVTDLETEKADLEDDLGHYVSRLNATTQENLSLKSELASLKEEKEKLHGELSTLLDLKSVLSTKLEQIQSDFLVSTNDKESLSTQLSLVSQEKDEVLLELENVKNNISILENELRNMKAASEEQQGKLTTQSLKMKNVLEEQEMVKKEFADKLRDLQDDCDEKSQQQTMLKQDLMEMQHLSENLQKEKQKLVDESQLLLSKNSALEGELAKYISLIEELTHAKETLSEKLKQVEAEKADALKWVEQVESSKKALTSEIETEQKLNEELVTKLQAKETLLSELKASGLSKEEILTDYMDNLSLLKQEKDTLNEELQLVLAEKEKTASRLELLVAQMSEKEKELLVANSLVEEFERTNSKERALQKKKIAEKDLALDEAHKKTNALEMRVADSVVTIQELEEKLRVSETEAEQKLKFLTNAKDRTSQQYLKMEETLQNLQTSYQRQKELLDKVEKEKEAQAFELQGSIDVKEDLLSETQSCLEKLRAERDSLKELLSVKNQIISCQNATASSLERQSSDELDVAMRILEGELQSSQSMSEKMAQDLREVQENFEEEKKNLLKLLAEARSTAKSYQQETVELKQQLSAPRKGGNIAELQKEEKIWQLERIKHQLDFQFDTMITQKADLEEHLCQLQEIIKEVTQICDNLFAALPPNCDAVHEVTVMRKEVEMKLRAVDRKYADSLCGIITLAHEMFKWSKTELSLTESEPSADEHLSSPDKEIMESKVSKSCEAMTSLTCDVRSVINSCKFLIERCESYLKAQTRESLKIKTSLNKECVEDVSGENTSQSNQSIPLPVEPLEQRTAADSSNGKYLGRSDWFGGSVTLEDGYCLMKKSHDELEKQVIELQSQLEKSRPIVEKSHHELEVKVAKLQDKVKTLIQRPTQEQLDDKLKDLHVQYSNKLETMKAKMKQIVKEEVDKVEEEKRESEKEIVAKYGKRITEFEEHVQQLSAQLWKLGEKLLQEQQDHKNSKEELAALKERERKCLMLKQRTQSLDRLDTILQRTNNAKSSSQLKRRCNNQSTQIGIASSRVHPKRDVSPDVVDESSSRRSTMMAPASMGLAFPEEDEDGEVFNNDYLAELKEGKCRVPLDGSRLSELQYRNSLCPPHLKSSYPLETQFHDPQSLKDDDIKGTDNRMRRQGKDRGTTSYKRPGPPTPSKKAGRLSLQGKEDVTPSVAALREHNESQTSHGSGMLRVAKTTPSRLRALFTSSKVANAATLPVTKKDENSTPATPTSKRLSIFRRRFGSNKENQSAASGYASFR